MSVVRVGFCLDSNDPVPVPVTTNLAGEEQQRQTLGDIRQLVVRARKGQFVHDLEFGSQVCERFLMLYETDQQALWDNVRDYADRENWWAGGPGDERWAGNRRPKRPPPMMAPASLPANGLTLEEALRKLGRVRAKGNEWRAFCPAHDTHHYSLVVSESDYKPGEPVFFCYAGCTHQAVKDALLRVEQ